MINLDLVLLLQNNYKILEDNLPNLKVLKVIYTIIIEPFRISKNNSKKRIKLISLQIQTHI